tara:strand:+ start:2175 stop:2594 length:420 start_codon:yes stop_codon:yes gene_type:complete
MENKFNILTEFIKDMSCETKDAQTFLHVKDVIKNYHLDFAIKAKPMKNKLIEVDTTLNFKDPNNSEKKAFFEIVYTSIVKIDDDVKDNDLKKILLCEVPKKIYPKLEKAFIEMLHNAGYEEIQPNKKIDFEELFLKNNS